jgi:hypothetical protein
MPHQKENELIPVTAKKAVEKPARAARAATTTVGKRAARAAGAELERELRGSFEEFMQEAPASEKWFLWQVFLFRDSSHASNEESCEFGLASAFEDFISRRGEYLCIEDEKLYDAVVRFIREYRECQKTGRFEAKPDGWRLWKNRKAAAS